MRQHRWMDYLEDHDFTLHYHPGMANVVVDAVSRKSWGVLSSVASREWKMLEIVGHFLLKYNDQAQDVVGSLVATPSLLSKVIESQEQDTEIVYIKAGYNQVRVMKVGPFTQIVVFGRGDGSWFIGDPQEFHCSQFTVLLGSTKMYHDLRRQYYWSGMKRHIRDFA